MNLIDMVEKETIKEDNTDFSIGDTVKVHVVIREGNKERIQIFKGDVIARKESGARATFTVRKISFG
ncbi:50S ribosomal protein L19, partial [Acidobacteriota bacterium]